MGLMSLVRKVMVGCKSFMWEVKMMIPLLVMREIKKNKLQRDKYHMWRSFGQGAGGPMGGGGIMKTVHKAVSAGTGGRGSSQEPFSRSATTHGSSTTSPTSRPSYKPSSSDYNSNTLSFSSVNQHNLANPMSWTNGEEYDGVNGFYDDYVFCTVPSMDEVHDAVSSLQQVLDPPTSSNDGWEVDWIEPSPSMLLSRGSESVYDAFHLLQTEPSVKRMVVSLSSDKSVWDAVMNNEAVRQLRDSAYEANKSISESSGKVESCDDSFPVSDILNWILINIKAKAMEIVESITKTLNDLLQSPKNNNKIKGESEVTESFEKKLRSSFLLSVMVLLIVIVSRANRC
ncbi:hypothetical protein L2E82_31828 [Cichorium intybus]|uniref:Uncharacterized protein n=1 Tax=Cichorium intybus TaxID=13427 RepID=A0ACB9BFV6_CICIN|nr:hypothetical protein L2E82_31828 [Cichorium intybus]